MYAGCAGKTVRSLEHLSNLEVWSRQSAIQIHVYLYLYLYIFLSFLSIHGSQQPRSGRPSNVFRTFGHRWNFINCPRDSVHHSPNFYRRVKSAKLGFIFDIARLWAGPAFEMQQYIWTLKLLWWASMIVYVLCKFNEVKFTRPWESCGESAPPLRLDGENALNRQLSREFFDFVEILYRGWNMTLEVL